MGKVLLKYYSFVVSEKFFVCENFFLKMNIILYRVSRPGEKAKYFEDADEAIQECEELAKLYGVNPVKKFSAWYEGSETGALLVEIGLLTCNLVEMPKQKICSGPPKIIQPFPSQ